MWSRLNPRYILNKLYYLYTFRQIRGGIDISSKILGEKIFACREKFSQRKTFMVGSSY